ncbi:MAG: SecY-interacting protein [Colwellia sp.]|nr:SecY-interacting protein [Colwellia sp.]MCW8866194.1 SecY-interacting protein [Colwellia sp.]MCW9082038.1 SecY-interacting protein [Colwellia sp.]
MTSSNSLSVKNHLSKTLQHFAEQFITSYKDSHGNLPQIEQDEQWPSPCEQAGTADKGNVFWQPSIIDDQQLSFDNVESALNLTLHEDIKTYFTTLYSESLEAKCHEGELTLLFAWNSDDFQRLQENIIGHILMKQRLKQEETIFFAVTDEEDTIISIANNSGEVWVEQVGCKPHKKISDSIAEFIAQLTPVVK